MGIDAMYAKNPVVGFKIASVEKINNQELQRAFASKTSLINNEANYKQALIAHVVNNPELGYNAARKATIEHFNAITKKFKNATYANVDFFHGFCAVPNPAIAESIAERGFISLVESGASHHGKALNMTIDPDRAAWIYGGSRHKSTLILALAQSGSTYPLAGGTATIRELESEMVNNFDGYYRMMLPRNRYNQDENVFFSISSEQDHATADEYCVFDTENILPLYIIHLKRSVDQKLTTEEAKAKDYLEFATALADDETIDSNDLYLTKSQKESAFPLGKKELLLQIINLAQQERLQNDQTLSNSQTLSDAFYNLAICSQDNSRNLLLKSLVSNPRNYEALFTLANLMTDKERIKLTHESTFLNKEQIFLKVIQSSEAEIKQSPISSGRSKTILSSQESLLAKCYTALAALYLVQATQQKEKSNLLDNAQYNLFKALAINPGDPKIYYYLAQKLNMSQEPFLVLPPSINLKEKLPFLHSVVNNCSNLDQKELLLNALSMDEFYAPAYNTLGELLQVDTLKELPFPAKASAINSQMQDQEIHDYHLFKKAIELDSNCLPAWRNLIKSLERESFGQDQQIIFCFAKKTIRVNIAELQDINLDNGKQDILASLEQKEKLARSGTIISPVASSRLQKQEEGKSLF